MFIETLAANQHRPPEPDYEVPVSLSMEIDRNLDGLDRSADAMAKVWVVQGAVHNALRFSSTIPLGKDQRTNCSGFTVVGSEGLDKTGVDYRIGFVNGHSTVFVFPNGEGDRIVMADMTSPELSQDVTDKLAIETPRRGVDRTEGQFFIRSLMVPEHDMYGRQVEYPWLKVGQDQGPSQNLSNGRRNDNRLIVTMHTPELGRQVVTDHARFHRAIATGDTIPAATAIVDMAGVFPDIDIRNKNPRLIRRMVKKLAKEGEIEMAEEVVEAFFSSFGDSQDTRVIEHEGDCLRSIAKITGRSEFAKRAAELYSGILSNSHAFKPSVAGKIAVSKSMIA